MIAQNKRLFLILLAIPLLLLIPFIAMQVTSEVNWTLSDFLVMGFLLLSVGLVGELIMRNIKKVELRLILGLVLLVLFFLVWAELAVGIFGSPLAGS